MECKEESPLPPELQKLTYLIPTSQPHTIESNLPPLGTQLKWSPTERNPAKADLGNLDILPIELINMVFVQLDIDTLFRHVRQVNRRALAIVESMPEYQTTVTYTPDIIHIIFKIKTNRFISLETLYEKLCTAECEECGDFGGYLYLITRKRVCFLCFTQNVKYQPLVYTTAMGKFGLDASTIKTLPQMQSIMGDYSPHQWWYARTRLVDYGSAYKAGIATHGSWLAMEIYVHEHPYDVSDFDFGSDGPINEFTSFRAVVRAPWLNRASKELVFGFHCMGCLSLRANNGGQEIPSTQLHDRRKFTVTSFAEHLKLYGSDPAGKHGKVPGAGKHVAKVEWFFRSRCDCCFDYPRDPRSDMTVGGDDGALFYTGL